MIAENEALRAPDCGLSGAADHSAVSFFKEGGYCPGLDICAQLQYRQNKPVRPVRDMASRLIYQQENTPVKRKQKAMRLPDLIAFTSYDYNCSEEDDSNDTLKVFKEHWPHAEAVTAKERHDTGCIERTGKFRSNAL